MNIALFGYILAWLGVIYFFLVLGTTYHAYTKLTGLQKQLVDTINLNKEILIFIVSTIYIITYHIS
jgi:hypothetical protein